MKSLLLALFNQILDLLVLFFYTPEFPQKCVLGKNNIDKLTIELTDQDGVALDMTGSVINQTDYEIFTLQIEIDTI